MNSRITFQKKTNRSRQNRQHQPVKGKIRNVTPLKIIETSDTLRTILFSKVSFPLVINVKVGQGESNMKIVRKSLESKSPLCVLFSNASPGRILEIYSLTEKDR